MVASSCDSTDGSRRCAGCNVVLISVDTLGAAHLGCYGYERDTAPNLCAFFEEGLRFDRLNIIQVFPNGWRIFIVNILVKFT